jgi:catechol 2,3-dioxygenase-like lactoylglutathione lyase family enzyme
MKIGFVRIFVSDFKKSLEFYTESLGMELDCTVGDYWAQFNSGVDIALAIEACNPEKKQLIGRYCGVNLLVDNVDETYQNLKNKGVEFTLAPEKQSWGRTLAEFKDLDGNILTLMDADG